MRHLKYFENNSYDNVWLKLEQILLNIGGDKVHKVYEEDIEDLITIGEHYLYSDSSEIKMQQSQCHSNSLIYYLDYIEDDGDATPYIMTGWVLDNDIWYQHTWVDLDYDSDNVLIETTHIRNEYFGFKLNDEQVEKFKYNYL